MVATKFSDHLLEGTHAARPAASATPVDALYACTDHDIIYQSNGVDTWSTWHDPDVSTGAASAISAHEAAADPHPVYPLESEMTTALAGKSDTSHNHDADYSDIAHTHSADPNTPDPTGATAGYVWTADGVGGADWGAAGSGYAPDPSAQPDDKYIKVSSGAYVFTDAPAGGSGGSPALNVYLYDNFK